MPLRVAYIAQIDAAASSGVCKKIVGQITEWQGRDVSTRVFAYGPAAEPWTGWSPIQVTCWPSGGLPSRLSNGRALARAVRAWRPNVIYFRMGWCDPAFASLAREFPMIVEVNTDEDAELPPLMGRVRSILYFHLRHALYQHVAGFVAVSREIAAKLARYERPTITVANGIRLADYVPRLPVAEAGPRIVFLGSAGKPWHGVDEVLEMARSFPAWQFDVVGYESGGVGEQVPPNVTCHGFLDRASYDPIVATADAALSSLALYRAGLSETSTLKFAEYLAYGLPIVAGHRHPDFPDRTPFILELPNEPGTVRAHLPEVAKFVSVWRGQRVPRNQVEHIDSRVKEGDRLRFMAQIAAVAL